jgi:hypothetical protein
MYFLLIQAQIFILFIVILNYLLLFSVRITNIRPNFILVLTVAFMTIPAQFDAKTIEDKWYDYWMKTIIFIRSQIIEPIYHSPPKCYWFFTHGAYVK